MYPSQAPKSPIHTAFGSSQINVASIARQATVPKACLMSNVRTMAELSSGVKLRSASGLGRASFSIGAERYVFQYLQLCFSAGVAVRRRVDVRVASSVPLLLPLIG